MKTIVNNLLRAAVIMYYFVILNYAYGKMDLEMLGNMIKVFSAVFLIAGLIVMEKAYKNEKGRTTLTSIELLVLSFHSLFIIHMITMYEYDFQVYLLASSFVIAIYYVFKSICIYTKDRKEYLKSLSDISEIVKEDEPIKKEAKKRNKEELEKDLEKNKAKDNKKENKVTSKREQKKKKTKKEENKND